MQYIFSKNSYRSLFFLGFVLFTSHQVNAQAIGTIGFSQQIVGNVGIGSTNPGQLLDVQGTVRALNFSGPGSLSGPYIKITNSQASGTNGGSTTAGSWQTAILNTKDFDTANIATLSSNTISLPAGTYQIQGSIPIGASASPSDNPTSIRLYNSTSSSVLLTGTDSYIGANGPVIVMTNFICGQFTLTTTSSISLQYNVGQSVSGYGQGAGASVGTEVYATIELWKIQ